MYLGTPPETYIDNQISTAEYKLAHGHLEGAGAAIKALLQRSTKLGVPSGTGE